MIGHCRKYLKIGKVSLRSLKDFSCLSFRDPRNTEWFYQRPSETGIFCWHPAAIRTFPARFRRETLISGWFPARIPLTSGENPVKRTCRIFPFPRTMKLRPEYCFHLLALFRPEIRGNLQESAGKNAVSGRILPDPVTGIIDLGSVPFTLLSLILKFEWI